MRRSRYTPRMSAAQQRAQAELAHSFEVAEQNRVEWPIPERRRDAGHGRVRRLFQRDRRRLGKGIAENGLRLLRCQEPDCQPAALARTALSTYRTWRRSSAAAAIPPQLAASSQSYGGGLRKASRAMLATAISS